MQPKLNKLITLLMLLGILAFIVEVEGRVAAMAKKELSEWASLLPRIEADQSKPTLNPYAQKVSIIEIFNQDNSKKSKSLLN